jgi:putative DeoR family transcriptional regulator (stage III sporulation protein D)
MSGKKIKLEYLSERVLKEAKYFLLSQSTLKKTANFSNRSSSTIHRDLTEKLPQINAELYREVRIILNKNIKERSARGGEATKQKYLKRQSNNKNV